MPAPASPRLPVQLTWLTPREQPERLLRSDEHRSRPQGPGLRQAGPIDARPRPKELPPPRGRRLRDHVPGFADSLARRGYLSALPCGDAGGRRHRRHQSCELNLRQPAGIHCRVQPNNVSKRSVGVEDGLQHCLIIWSPHGAQLQNPKRELHGAHGIGRGFDRGKRGGGVDPGQGVWLKTYI
eukprot:bmy_03269T0